MINDTLIFRLGSVKQNVYPEKLRAMLAVIGIKQGKFGNLPS